MRSARPLLSRSKDDADAVGLDGLRRVCEAAHQNGYCVVVVGTDGFATHVPLREADSFPVVNVPCVVLPAEGQKLRRCEGRRVGAVRCSGAPVGGERGRDLPAPGGRGAEGLHGAFAGRRRGEWRAGESSLRDLECLLEQRGVVIGDLECLLEQREVVIEDLKYCVRRKADRSVCWNNLPN